MHRTERYVEKVYFGYDLRSFYMRLDLSSGRRGLIPSGTRIEIHFVEPREIVLSLEMAEPHRWGCRIVRAQVADLAPMFAGGKILELGVSLSALGILKPQEVKYFLAVLDRDRELERFPSNGYISVPLDPWGLDQQEWMV